MSDRREGVIPDAAPARPGLLGPGAVVAAGMAVGQVLGYALSVLGARLLGPALFGELSSLTGLLVIGAVVPLAVQTVAARRVAADDVGSDAPTLVRLGLVTGIGVTAIGLVLVPLAVGTLRLETAAALLVAVSLFPLTMAGIGIGRAQGREQFTLLGGLYAVLAIGRTGLAVAVLVVTRSLVLTMAATAVGSVLAWLIIHWREQLPWRPSASLPRPLRQETWHVTHALLAMFVFTNADLLLARSTLSPEDAGGGAAGAIIIKIAFWLPQAVAVVVFPRLAEGSRRTLVRGVGVVVALGLSVTVGVALVGRWVLPALIGPGYDVVVANAWIFGLAGTAEAVAYLLLFSRLAAEDRLAAFVVWLAVVALAVLVVTVAHSSPVSIALAVLGVSLALCAVGAWAHRHDAD